MSCAAGRSVKTGTQYSSNAVMISLMPPMPACAYTGVPSRIWANGGNGLDARRVREERELTVVRTALQALIALAALRRARDDDAIADLDALDHRADGLDDAEAAVVRDLRAPDRVGAERAAHDRVARRHGQGADDHLPRIDRQQPHLLNVERAGVADEPAERPSGLRAGEHGWGLRVLCADGWHTCEKSRAAAECGRARLQNASARQTPFAVRLGSHAALR